MIKMIRPFDKPITVARPALPPLEEFRKGLEGIWSRAWLTNDGPLVQQFRDDLMAFCRTDNLSLFTNGTLALQIAIQGMGITGDVITTPYTFVATTNALVWNNIRPVFVDIEPEYYSLDPRKVEDAITPWTSAILAVHVYGHPCRLHELAEIAHKHGLKLLYDAAHAFGVKVYDTPIGHFGDLSMFSFHATKIFHSIEGGMLTFRDPELRRVVDYLKNFGFENEMEVVMPGTNAKMSEFQALMGLLLLKRVHDMIETRRVINNHYRRRLSQVAGIRLAAPPCEGVRYNYAYMPIEVNEDAFGLTRNQLYLKLRDYNVLARRYFYPIVPDFPCYRGRFAGANLPIARRAASRIITLPIYSDLALDDVDRICDMIEYFHACASAGVALSTSSQHHDSPLTASVA